MLDAEAPGARARLHRLKRALRATAGAAIDAAASATELLALLRTQTDAAGLGAADLQRLVWKLRPDLHAGKARFSTQEIVDSVAHAWSQRVQAAGGDNAGDTDTFEAWQQQLAACTDALQVCLPAPMAQHLPLSEEVAKQVYAELCGSMPYVINRYERVHDGMPFLFFPAARAKRLLILFSGNVGRKTYNRYSWYWDASEEWLGDTACLFLCDVESHWYVGREGSDARRIYRDIIDTTLRTLGLGAERAYAVGASMGGYGAILYALQMGLGAAIAVHPQLSFRSALRYKEPSWEERIRECGRNFRDLTDEVCRTEHRPLVYLEYGDNEADRCGVDEFIAGLCRREATVIVRHTQTPGHMTDNPMQRHIDATVRFVEAF